jgi:hypothetical protein
MDLHLHFAMTVYLGAISAVSFFVPLLISTLPILSTPKLFLVAMIFSLTIFVAYGVGFALLLAWVAVTVVHRRRRARRRALRLRRFAL